MKKLILNGAGNIARAVAVRMAEQGWQVSVFDEDIVKALELLDALPEENRGIAVKVDWQNEESLKTAVEKAGGADALFNSALQMERKLAKHIEAGEMEALFARNVTPMFYCARACAPYMKQNGGGRIVNLSSVHAHVADGYHMEYAVTASAINALTRQLAVSYWKDNIQVNTVTTCFVDGQFADELDMDQRQTPERISLLGRRVTAQDVAGTVKFLLTCETKCVNGAEIRADAGYITTQYRVGDAPFVKITG
ncbi:MAG: SDR family NAD(P)-dependent oxidoreductase [Christensenellales bacterium]|jgi:NAD(P)-dependent dehydrogenase (short-subunit alcohol dehydrogenase family)